MAENTRTKELEECYERTVDSVYRVCRMYYKDNISEIEDVVQTTYLKWLKNKKPFENKEHEKAWLLVTAANICKNNLKHWWSKNIDIESMTDIGKEDIYHTETALMEQLRLLPEKYRITLYLHYYEGYTGTEIAGILKKKESTVWGYLHEGRKMLKKKLEGDFYAQRV